MELFGYVYKTVIKDKGHPFDGCFYIGQKWGKEIVSNYYGSGQKIKSYIADRGTEHLSIEILDWAMSLEELNQKERTWIEQYIGKTPFCLNAKIGGGQSMMSQEARKKQSERMRKCMKGNTYTLGYKHSEESKRRISRASRALWKNVEYRNKQLKRMRGTGNPMYGKKHSPESLEKMREAARQRKVSDTTRKKHSEFSSKCHWWNNGINEKFCIDCPEGYLKGRIKK